MSKYAYTVERSYHPAARESDKNVIALLEKGYEFVRASEFVPADENKAGYIEYVLRIPVDETDEEKEQLKANVEHWQGLATQREKTMRKLDEKIADNVEEWDKLEDYLGRRVEQSKLTQHDPNQDGVSKHYARIIERELKDIIKKVHECRGGKEE